MELEGVAAELLGLFGQHDREAVARKGERGVQAAAELLGFQPREMEGQVIQDLSWSGFIDSDADADRDPFNEPATEIRLADFYVGFDPGSRILMLNQSAGWCPSCQEEMPFLVDLDADYRDRGGRILVAIWQNDDESPGSVAFVDEWGTYFHLTNPAVADPNDLLGPYFEENTIPMNLLVDTSNMTIIDVRHEYDDDYVRQVFEAYADPN